MGDLGDISQSGSSGNSVDDSIMEGVMAHGGGARAATSLEGDVADTGTSPSRGRPSFQRTTLSHVVRRSLMHEAPSTPTQKCRKLVLARHSSDAGGPSMLVGPTSPPPHPSTSLDAPTMATVMPIAIRGSLLRPHSLTDAFMVVHHGGATKGGPLVVPPCFS